MCVYLGMVGIVGITFLNYLQRKLQFTQQDGRDNVWSVHMVQASCSTLLHSSQPLAQAGVRPEIKMSETGTYMEQHKHLDLFPVSHY